MIGEMQWLALKTEEGAISKRCGRLPEAGKGKERDSLQALPKELGPEDILVSLRGT